MLKKMPAVLAMLLLTAAAWAQVDIDFQRLYQGLQAERDLDGKKPDKAQVAFAKLSDTAPDDASKAMWASRAAVALGSQKGRQDEGLAAARAIAVRPYSVTAQLEIMLANEDYQAMVSTLGDESIADWPAMTLPQRDRMEAEDARVHAGYARARAFMETGDFKKADADFALAGSLAKTSSLGLDIWLAAGHNRSRNLKDAASAHEAYMNAITAANGRGGASFFTAIVQSVRYLNAQKQYDQAIEVLQPLDPMNREGTWGAQANLLLAEALVGQRKWDQAIAAYDRVIDSDTARGNQRIAALEDKAQTQAAAGRTNDARATYQQLIDDDQSSAAQKAAAKKAMEKL